MPPAINRQLTVLFLEMSTRLAAILKFATATTEDTCTSILHRNRTNMAVSGTFGDYKVGSISDFLSSKNDAKSSESNAGQLRNLFNKQNDGNILREKEKQELKAETTVNISLAPKKIDEEQSKRLANIEGSTGVKRKQVQKNLSAEPSRKKQRENRKKEKVISDNEDNDNPERLARTIFVGNVPLSTSRKELKTFFSTYGRVESVRLRSVPVAEPKYSKKLAIVKREFHAERSSMNAYVVFTNKNDAESAIEARGSSFKDMHLRVDMAVKKEVDNRLSVFVGNLPFNIQEEELREHFIQCGDVDDVRIIRDKKTGAGKGFGYVAFKKKESVGFAIKLQNSELKGRKIRVFKSVDKSEAKRSFNKKKDRQYRLKDVTSKKKNPVKGQKKVFPVNKKKIAGHSTKGTQKNSRKSINNGSKGFSSSKGKKKFRKMK